MAEKARVLCVDDDYPILESLRHFPWETYRCEWVGEASNGQSALKKLDILCPDVVLVDVVMPVMDGLDFIRMAKETHTSLQFIIISSYCDFHYARQAIRFGVSEYLTKGEYSDEELGEVLQRILRTDNEALAYRYEIRKVIHILEKRLGEELTLENIAEEIGISPNYLGMLFYQQTGTHFREYLMRIRMKRAKKLLLHSPLKMYEIAKQVGIQNPQYFTSLFKRVYGMTPGKMRGL